MNKILILLGVLVLGFAGYLIVVPPSFQPSPQSDAAEIESRRHLGAEFVTLDSSPIAASGHTPRRVLHEPTGIVLIGLEPGSYLRGSPRAEEFHQQNEAQFEVAVEKSFYLAETELTVAQWKKIMGEKTPLDQSADDLPLSGLSWHQAQDLLETMNERFGGGWRLPNEIEWEYACRAGTTTPFSFGESIHSDQANFNGEKPYPRGAAKGIRHEGPIAVKSYPPNPWGFYDMHGNLWEWCSDLYVGHPEYGDVANDEPGASRVIRGGGFAAQGKRVRSAYRDGYPPYSPGEKYGVRLVLSLED